jgi:hypothetical protein
MRNPQAGFVNHQIAKENQIQIERTRSARIRSLSTGVRLHFQQQIEQLARRQGCGARDRGIEKARLGTDAHWFRFVKARDAEIGEIAAEPFARSAQMDGSIAQVAAECDRCGGYWPTQRVPSTWPRRS